MNDDRNDEPLERLLERIRELWPEGGIEVNGHPDRGWRATVYYKDFGDVVTKDRAPEVVGFTTASAAATALLRNLVNMQNIEAARAVSRETPFSYDELIFILNTTCMPLGCLPKRVEFLKRVVDLASAQNLALHVAGSRLDSMIKPDEGVGDRRY